MAKNRLVDRAKAAAQRSAAETPMESHQRRYQSDLTHEIGPTNFGRPMRDDEDASLLSVMTQPAMILILAIITFALTFIVLLWREGRLDNIFPPTRTEIVKDPKAWMLGRNADGRVEDTDPSREETVDSANATSAPEEPSATLADDALEPNSASEAGE